MTPSAVPIAHHRANLPVLVGREREQRLLRDHLAAALGGQGRLVLVRGEAGIGKTTLVAAAARDAAAHGALVLGGGCYDLTAAPPYGPWRDLAADYRPAAGLPPLPGVLAAADEIEGVGGQGAVFAQVRAFLAAVAAIRPAMVVLEDLHWADPASLDLLRFVARQVTSVPLLLVATYRADELTRRHPLYLLLPVLVREARADRLDLRRLDEAAVRRLVTGDYPLPEHDATRLVDHLQVHAEGNPFYVRELLRTLEEEGALRPDGDGWALGNLARAHVPTLLRQVIDGRVARLGEEARDLLAVAAVIGQEVPLALWSAVGERAEEHLLAVVERAVEAHLLEAAGDGASVRFGHALIREALYEGILPPRRRTWHRRIGEVLAAGYPLGATVDPDAVAHHFGQAGDARATEWLLRAGERAERAYAWLTAGERYAAVAAALEGEAARAGERGWLLYRIGRLLRFADPARALSSLEEAERVAVAVADPALAAYALVEAGKLRCYGDDLRRGLAEMAAGVAALDALPAARAQTDAAITTGVADSVSTVARDDALASPPGLNPRRGALVQWLANGGRFAEARTIGETYLDQVAAVPRPDDAVLSSTGDAHHGLGLVYAALGQPDTAEQSFARARAAHRAVGDHMLECGDAVRELATVTLPYRTTHLGKRRQVQAEAEAAWARGGQALALGGPPDLANSGNLLGFLLLDWTWTDARELERTARANTTWFWGNVAAGLGALARYQGASALAWALVREALPEGPATEPGRNFFRTAVALQRLAAELALDAGDLGLAHAWIEAHDRWLAWSGGVLGQAEAGLLWARYHRLAGDGGLARQHAEAALARAGAPSQPVARLVAHRLLGELATEGRRLADAEQHLGEALALADACAAPFERALTLLAQAELRAAGGDTAEARAHLSKVRAICTPLGAAPTLERADALAATLAAAPVAVVGHPAGLTPREVEVLRLLVEGRSNPEIAAALFISPRTATTHVTNILAKLGAQSRTEAATHAVRHGLV